MARILVNMPSQHGGRPSGVARVALSLLERLVRRGAHSYVLRSNFAAADLPPGLAGAPLDRIETPRPAFMILDMARQLVAVPRLCRALGVDVVWNVDAFGAARGGRARVTTLHDLFFLTAPELYAPRSRLTMALCNRLILLGSTAVVGVSATTVRDLARFAPRAAAAATVIPNATDIDAVAPDLALPVPERFVLLVGNATANKGFALAVDALGLLAEAGDGPALVHVGRDPDGTIDAALARLRVRPPVVRFQGIDDAALAGLYARARCLAVTSRVEGFCLPIVEAQALRCPVVSVDASAMPEVAGGAALLVPPDDPAAMAVAIRRLDEDPDLRADLVRRGLVNRARYTWEAAAEAYEGLFTALAAG